MPVFPSEETAFRIIKAGTSYATLVEADIGRWKRVIGHVLRSQTDKRQATEVALAVDVLNRMLALGRPSYVRIV